MLKLCQILQRVNCIYVPQKTYKKREGYKLLPSFLAYVTIATSAMCRIKYSAYLQIFPKSSSFAQRYIFDQRIGWRAKCRVYPRTNRFRSVLFSFQDIIKHEKILKRAEATPNHPPFITKWLKDANFMVLLKFKNHDFLPPVRLNLVSKIKRTSILMKFGNIYFN